MLGGMDLLMTKAPWTDDEVAALNGYQVVGVMHPFTCGRDGHAATPENPTGGSPDLVATNAGWVCPDPACEYTQNWAHEFMLTKEARTPWFDCLGPHR